MRGKSFVLLLLALGCGLVASVGITQVMSKRADGDGSPPEMEKILVAVKDLPMGDPIVAQSVKLEDWPKDKVPRGALTKLEDVERRRPKTKVYAGSPILEAQLLGKGDTDNAVGAHIPPGYRVIDVASTNTSGTLVRPGDRVDLLLCVQANPHKQIHETSTRTILQDIKVFAIDGRYRLDAEELQKLAAPKVVSLLVTPDQAQKIMLATELGTLRLAMRSPEDQQQPKVAPSNPTDLFGASDGAKREKERESTRKADRGDDFLSFLQAHQNPLPPPTPKAETRRSFAVRVITGAEVNDMMLELAELPDEQKDQSAPGVWRVSGSHGVKRIGPPATSSPAPTTRERTKPAKDKPSEANPSGRKVPEAKAKDSKAPAG